MDDVVFNEDEYLRANPDVATAVKEGVFRSGREHYETYGKKEGRRLFGKDWREENILRFIDKKGLGLEIGPSFNPIAPKKKGYNVHILDCVSAEELRNKYQGHDVSIDNIEEVDFIWQGEDLPKLIGKTCCYDWVIASHVIEHVPDFVSFLQQCEVLLKPDCFLFLAVPDKRYCFDYFSETTSTGQVLDAFAEKRMRPAPGQIFDHVANFSKRKGKTTWLSDGQGGADELMNSMSQAEALWERSVSSKEYIDVHCWRFTPASFRLIISDLLYLGLTSMEIKEEFDTKNCEFFVVLGKKIDALLEFDRLDMLRKKKFEND